MPEETTLRFAVAQSTVHEDPTNATLLRESGDEVRGLMRQAATAGARLVHFTEGAICFPSKRVMSSLGPDEIGPSDWTKADWAVLQDELDQITRLAGQLGIWTVIPSVHQLPDARPHNSAYVVSDKGQVVARYDDRALSTTKVTWMYTPGTAPVTFELDGYRFGLAIGLDMLFPEFFTEYDRLGVDAVLVSYASTHGPNRHIGVQACGTAANNTCWISLAVTANSQTGLVAGVTNPRGEWVAQAPEDGRPAIAVAELRLDDWTDVGRTFRRRTRERISS
ncbi:carbon-nitrogen hydrolase family protein [Kribbella speibonae]|uniref:Carbon-nitrogen hydrolase family protein n=1 Tax=Kribbella speibonae TaxID=1572660 RepID=A0A4R0JEY5_9ACTN|nr:carbon-nitrogen hydrolase family protein [Kribbella speibonae]TCC16172.1 carbon-nitrogen hydrolase family protein [Kribbella speibonae]TCC40215.1 carbon-nitrogen hydrolase family protein [Kribbella speibonae]